MIKNTSTTLGILAVLLLSFAMASAAVDFYPENLTGSVEQGKTFEMKFKIYNKNSNTDLTEVIYTTENLISGTNELSASQTLDNLPSTIENKTNTTEITYSVTIPSNQTTGKYEGNLTIKGKYTAGYLYYKLPISITITAPSSVPGCIDPEANNYNSEATEDDGSCTYDTAEYNFCEINGKVGDLEIVDVEFTNLGEGEDDDWFLLDEIEIEVEIENTHSTENVRDVLVEIKILDEDDNDVTRDFEFDNEEIDLNTVKDGDSEYATFKISELPADIESGRYKLYIKAYSEDDEESQCVAEATSRYLDEELYQKIDTTREEDPAVIIKEDTLKISASCGDKNIELPLSIYNLGSDKEEKVLVTLRNSALGLDEKIIIDDIRSGKRKEITFFFNLPAKLSRATYNLDITTYYDYDDDEDELDEFSYSENSNDDLDKDFSIRLEVLSCKSLAPTIDANLGSEAIVGTELIIKTIIVNNDEATNFAISVSDFESWAKLISISPQTTLIGKGESTEVLVTLEPTSEGAHSFKIRTIVDGEIHDQQVSVNIEEEQGLFTNMNNTIFYMIAGIAALLALIFLVLIVKISQRSAKPQF